MKDYNFLIRLAAIDIAKGTCILPWYCFFQRSLRWNRNQIQAYQTKRIKQIIHHSFNTVPYYRDVFNDLNITPKNFIDSNDLKILPILTRETIQNNQSQLLSSKYRISQLVKGSSSGSTGIPIHYYHNKSGISAGIAAGYTLWSMSGWILGQKSVHIWGNDISVIQWKKLSSRLKNGFLRQLNIASTRVNIEEELDAISKQIIRHAPECIDGYPSTIATLAKYFEKYHLEIPSLRRVLTTAENLTSSDKEIIERTFAPIGDLYGSGEVLGIASRPAGLEEYYFLDSHVFVEVEPTKIENMYNVLVTDLDNYGMPLIRYKIGDLIDSIHAPSDQNKYQFAWFTKIHGRTSEIIELPNGMALHPVNILGGTLYRQYPQIMGHKAIWDGNMLHFIFAVSHNINHSEIEKELSKQLEKYSIAFDVKYTDKIIPGPGGKRQYFENIANQTKHEGPICQ